MWKIAEYYRDGGETEKAIAETQRALALISAMAGEEKIDRFNSYVEYFNSQIKLMSK